jgi:NADH dehydrogenase
MRTNINKKIAVIGGTGFLGKSLLKLLLKENSDIILFTRKKNYQKKLNKIFPDSDVKCIQWNLNNLKAIEENTKDIDCIINLCGILFENKNGDFFRVHSDVPALLGRISLKNKIKTLIHVSALGVSMNAESKYSRSKAEGENKLLEHFPNGKILRPSLLYGKGDNFFGQFSDMATFSPFLPVISRSTKFQPVFVEDVAKAIIKLLKDKKYKNNIYELAGDKIYSFEELLKILLEIKNIKRLLVPLNPKLMMIPAFFLQNLPKPPFTVDQMILLKTDNILKNGLPGLKDLGIKISDMETELLKIYK